MKSITSKISVITLSLLACTFTFILGTTSSKAVGDGNSFEQCVAGIQRLNAVEDFHDGMNKALNDIDRKVNGIIACANK